MAENILSFGDSFTDTEEESETPELLSSQSLDEQNCSILDFSIFDSYGSSEDDEIQCEENIFESTDSEKITTSVISMPEFRSSQSLNKQKCNYTICDDSFLDRVDFTTEANEMQCEESICESTDSGKITTPLVSIPEFLSSQSLNKQKCSSTICNDNFLAWLDSTGETNEIQCKESISESTNSGKIATPLVNSCSETLSNISVNPDNSCSMCLKSYKKKSGLQQHMASKHRIGDYKCEFCDAIFAFSSKLKEHTERHINGNVRPYDCQYCQSYFKTKRDVDIHALNVHSVRKFQCSLCNLSYTTKNSLQYHQSIEHKDEKLN